MKPWVNCTHKTPFSENRSQRPMSDLLITKLVLDALPDRSNSTLTLPLYFHGSQLLPLNKLTQNCTPSVSPSFSHCLFQQLSSYFILHVNILCHCLSINLLDGINLLLAKKGEEEIMKWEITKLHFCIM